MAVAKSFLRLKVLVFRFRADRVHPSLAVGAVRLFELFCLRHGSSAVFERFPTDRFGSSFPLRGIMPSQILPANKSSRRRLNTGSALISRQEATPASAEVGPSTSSTPSVSLRGDAESAEVSSSLSGQTIMDTHGSVVPSQSSLVEPRINKRRDRSPSETSDGRADTSRGNPSSDRGNPSPDRGNLSTIRGNPFDEN